MSFKNIAVVTSLIALVLGIGYLFFGSFLIGRWQIEPTNNVLLLGRRMGILYIGLSIIFFQTKSLNLSKARTALSIGAASTLSLLAIMGIYEYSMGRVGAGILASVVIESLLSLGYIIILIKDRKAMMMESLLNK
jgi:hypothetical protein